MNKGLKIMLCFFSAMTLVSSADFEPIFGPPNVTLHCSADYVNLKRQIEVSWKPILLNNKITEPLSTEEVKSRIQNCGAVIICNGGYKITKGCPRPRYNMTTNSYSKWRISLPFYETFCSVQVSYWDHENYHDNSHTTTKECSFSVPHYSTIIKQSSTGSGTVGEPYSIQCSIYTSEKMNSSIITTDWIGPDGSITNDSRVKIYPAVSNNGIKHNSTLQFLYLRQNDTGPFTCNVTILNTTLSQTFQLNNITESPSTFPTTITVSDTTVPVVNSTGNSSTTTVEASTFTGTAQIAIITSVVTGFLFISLLAGLVIYKFKRKFLKKHYPTDNDIKFKAPSISDAIYSITDKDAASTCENLDINDKVVGWMKTMQESNLDEEHNDSYPNHEEVLNYLCGKNLKGHDLGKNVKSSELSKAEKDIYPSTVNIGGQLYSDSTKSVILLEENDFNKDNSFQQQNSHDVPIFYKDSSHVVINSSEEDYVQSTEESEKRLYVTLKTNVKLAPDGMYMTNCQWYPSQKSNDYSDYPRHHGSIMLLTDRQVKDNSAVQQEDLPHQNGTIANEVMSHGCYSKSSNNMQMEVNSDELSLDSSDKLTEDTLVSSVSSYSVNACSVDEDYIENKSPTHNVIHDIVYIPIQPHDFHQNNITHFDDKTFPPSTVGDGDYVDHNIAIQPNA